MSEHPAYRVYETLPHFFAARDLVADAPLEAERNEFVGALSRKGYFCVRARPRASEKKGVMAVYLLAEGSPYATSGPRLEELLVAHKPGEDGTPHGGAAEIAIIAPPATLGKANMVKVVAAARRQQRASIRDPAARTRIGFYPFTTFSVNLSRCPIPRHSIVPPAEAQKILRSLYLSREDLPKLPANDPPVVWIGGRPGDVVQVVRPSAAALAAVTYLTVI